jgi:N-acetylmuramate 1-kinase
MQSQRAAAEMHGDPGDANGETPSSTAAGFTRDLPDLAGTQRLAMDVANILQPGDFVALSGDLGTGKTTLVRAIISYLAGDPDIEVPSPTFTLVQTYDLKPFTLFHVDLYRLSDTGELAELGLDDLPGAVTAMEWPDRAGALPADRIEIALVLGTAEESGRRTAQITGYGTAAPRIGRLGGFLGFLDDIGYGHDARSQIAGDASTRLYERLIHAGRPYIVMNAPPRPDGPAVKRGLSYSAIAHLAEDVKSFVAVAKGLRNCALSAPRIFAADHQAGFVVMEDFGSEPVVSGSPPQPIAQRYERATDVLIDLHSRELPEVLPIAPKLDHRLPIYDLDAFLIEAELLVDWYLPYRGSTVSGQSRALFLSLWRDALRPVLNAGRTWVLRDFHSPNLLWLEDRVGLAQIGLLDFQDAVLGPAAYDLASLLQDARVDVPEELETALFARYVHARRERHADFDATAFARIYSTLAAQRATKVLGIFARLDRRDGKRQYLQHLPRVFANVRRALSHPALASLERWYSAHVPAP